MAIFRRKIQGILSSRLFSYSIQSYHSNPELGLLFIVVTARTTDLTIEVISGIQSKAQHYIT